MAKERANMDLYHGNGKETFSHGRVYEGGFKDGVKHDKGKATGVW